MILDEVITGFGRLGAGFAADYFDLQPDIVTTAKGLTNATVPMGAVLVTSAIYDAFMQGPDIAVELPHGYTYSAHPLAVAAGLATLDLYQREGLFQRAAEMAPVWEEAVHGLKGARHVIDVRNIGLMAGIELEPRPDAPAARAYEAFLKCFDKGLLVRTTGDIIALSPPLIVERSHIDEMFAIIGEVLAEVA